MIIRVLNLNKRPCHNFLLQQSKLFDVDITYFILICATLSFLVKGFNNIYRVQRYKKDFKRQNFFYMEFLVFLLLGWCLLFASLMDLPSALWII